MGQGVLRTLRCEVRHIGAWMDTSHGWAEDGGVPMVEVFWCSPVAELGCGTW